MSGVPKLKRQIETELPEATDEGTDSARHLQLVRPRIARKYQRYDVCCEVVVAFPTQHAHPRMKGHMFQVGHKGCALSTSEAPYIGAKCIVWALGAGQRYLGVRGQIAWVKPVRDLQKHAQSHGSHCHAHTVFIGIEFDDPTGLDRKLLTHLGWKPQK